MKLLAVTPISINPKRCPNRTLCKNSTHQSLSKRRQDRFITQPRCLCSSASSVFQAKMGRLMARYHLESSSRRPQTKLWTRNRRQKGWVLKRTWRIWRARWSWSSASSWSFTRSLAPWIVKLARSQLKCERTTSLQSHPLLSTKVWTKSSCQTMVAIRRLARKSGTIREHAAV